MIWSPLCSLLSFPILFVSLIGVKMTLLQFLSDFAPYVLGFGVVLGLVRLLLLLR